MNRVEVLERIGPLVEGEVRHINDAQGTRVSVLGETLALRPRRHAQVVDVAPEGARSMVSFVGLPLNIAKILNPRTFGDVLGELLEHAGSYSMVVKEDKVVDIIPYGKKAVVSPERLLDVIEKALPVQYYNRVDILPNRVANIINL